MSENDQPPVPPQSPDSEPTDSEPTAPEPTEPVPTEPEPTEPEPTDAEPTPVDLSKDEALPAEDDVVIAPPVPGDDAAPAAPARNKNVIIAAAVVAAIVVIGGIVWAVIALGGDDDDTKKDEAASIADFCKVIKEMDASDETKDDPSIVSDALRDAGVPKEMGDDEKKGRDLLIKIGDESEDGPAAEKAVTELEKDETAQVQAFITYIGTACAETTPSESPS